MLQGSSLKVTVSLLVGAVLACGLMYTFSDPNVGVDQGSWALRFRAKMAPIKEELELQLDQQEVIRVLNNAAMVNRTVIITTVNEAWAMPNSTLDLFLESFRIGEQTEHLLNHLVIVAVDPQAFQRCKSLHPHCLLLTTPGIDFAGEKVFMSQDYLTLMWRRVGFLQTVLELGYSFVFTDSDIMWLRNPFQHLSPKIDITLASDYFRGDPADMIKNLPNGGFLYVRCTDRTIKFYKYWILEGKQYPGKHDQQVLDIIIKQKKYNNMVRRMGLQMRFLDTAYFGGFCQPSKDLNKVCTMHANCCVGLDKKLHDLGVILDDWKNYRAQSANDKKHKRQFSWRAPDKCKM